MDQVEEQLPGESPSKKVKENLCALSSLKEHTVVVADTGKFNEIQKYKPQDATTNPSLILEVSKQAEYANMIDQAIEKGVQSYLQAKAAQILVPKQAAKKKQPRKTKSKKNQEAEEEKQEEKKEEETEKLNFEQLDEVEQQKLVEIIIDQLCVSIGLEILKLVPGYVSTEVDARLSFDKQATINKAKRIIQLYDQAGIKKDRILIKIASTWEGIEAAKALKKDGIQCNMTLIFNYYQALACAQNNIRLISPFVGRILDWHKKNKPESQYSQEQHPGVVVVRDIYNYFKKYKHDTIVMAASLRTPEECEELCGCDRLTIPITVLEQLQNLQIVQYEKKLSKEKAQESGLEKVVVDEKVFRWQMNGKQQIDQVLVQQKIKWQMIN